jgi:hypothetical protein
LLDSDGYVKDPLAAFEAAMMKKDRRMKRSRSRSPPPPHFQRRYSPQRIYRFVRLTSVKEVAGR